MAYLAIADADKIHDYVFSPHELRLIRGGSFLQTRLNRSVLPEEVKKNRGVVISANGGTVLAKFDILSDADAFCRGAEQAFRRQTGIATITTAVTEFPDGQWEPTKKRLDRLLEQRKRSAPVKRFGGGGPFWTACESCGMHPAVHAYYTPSDKRWICDACECRRKSSGEPPRAFSAYRHPDRIDEIGTSADPENYVAFAYFDLDRLGRFMAQNGATEQSWRDFSDEIDQLVVGAVIAGCNRLSALEAPFQVLAAGGDDAIVILPANLALEFVTAFHGNLPGLLTTAVPRPTYSVGVVIAHDHFPIFEFRRLAEELLRSAKRIDWEGEPNKPDSIDFAVLTASMTDSIVEERREIALRTIGPQRSGKPYSVDQFLQMGQRIRQMKNAGVPRSKVQSLYNMVHGGKSQAELEYLYLLSRLSPDHRQELRGAVGQELFRPGPKGSEVTVAADLVELWEFARGT